MGSVRRNRLTQCGDSEQTRSLAPKLGSEPAGPPGKMFPWPPVSGASGAAVANPAASDNGRFPMAVEPSTPGKMRPYHVRTCDP